MKLEIDGVEYKIQFRHDVQRANALDAEIRQKLVELKALLRQRTERPKQTHCTIWKGADQISFGLTKCAVNDRYSRETGRKRSLADALQRFDRMLRNQFWQAYLNRKRGTAQSQVG